MRIESSDKNLWQKLKAFNQPVITSSNLTIEPLEQGVKHIQS